LTNSKSQNKSLDPRLRVNIELGMHVMIEEESSDSNLVPCYVKEIITKDPKHESGIKVICEDGKKGRVKHIGTEAEFMDSMDLLTSLEKKLRKLIVDELSKGDPNWWKNKISPTIREAIEEKLSAGEKVRKRLQIPDYELIEETFFSQLPDIILAKKNWNKHFSKIFADKNEVLVKLAELTQYRNPAFHSKDLTPHIEKKIQVYYEDLILPIENYYRNLIKS